VLFRSVYQAYYIRHRVLGVAERKPLGQTFLKYNCGESLSHIFTENSAFIMGEGRCSQHGRTCKVSTERPDCVTGGLPCQPFSKARHKGGPTKRTFAADEHPDYVTVMEEFRSYLACRQPRSFWIEEVCDMETTYYNGIGESCLMAFARLCTAEGYAVRAFKLDHCAWVASPWLRMPRLASS